MGFLCGVGKAALSPNAAAEGAMIGAMIGAMTATVDNLVHNSRILPKNLTFPARDGSGRPQSRG